MVYCGTPLDTKPQNPKRWSTPVDFVWKARVDQMRPYEDAPDKAVVEAALRLAAEFSVASPEEWSAVVQKKRNAADAFAEFVKVARAPQTAKRYRVGGTDQRA